MFNHVATWRSLLPKAALLAIVVSLAATEAQAGEQLSGRQLQQLFPGRFEAVVRATLPVSITARRDGFLLARFMGKSDSGNWSIRSDKLCIRFSKWRGGRTSCSPVVEEAGWYRTSGVAFREVDDIALAAPTASVR